MAITETKHGSWTLRITTSRNTSEVSAILVVKEKDATGRDMGSRLLQFVWELGAKMAAAGYHPALVSHGAVFVLGGGLVGAGLEFTPAASREIPALVDALTRGVTDLLK